jgi:hypothetical protein
MMMLAAVLVVAGAASAVYFALQEGSKPDTTIDVPEGRPAPPKKEPDESEQTPATPPRPIDRTPSEPPPAPVSPSGPATRGLQVSGIVRDDRGVPVAGITVVIVAPWAFDGALPRPRDAFDLFQRASRKLEWPRTRSREDGRFLLTAEKPGPNLLFGGPPSHQEGWKTVQILQDEPLVGVELVVPQGLSIRGRVVDVDGEAGIGAAQITATQQPTVGEDYKGRRIRHAKTATDGGFSVEGFHAGAVEVEVRSPEGSYYEVEGHPRKRVTAGADDVIFRLWTVGVVEFRALDAEAKTPLAGPIRVEIPGSSRFKVRVSVTMESPGTYALRGYASAPLYRLEAPGYVPLEVRFEVQPGGRTIRSNPVLFSKGGRLAGTVVLQGAEERTAAFVYYEPVRGGETAIRYERVSGGGEYVIKGLASGRYRLWALASGFRAGKATVTLGEGETRQDFTLTPRDPSDPPAPASKPYAQCRNKTVSIALSDVSLPEMVDWIREMTGADVKIRPGLEASEDEMKVQLQVDRIALGDVIQLVTQMRGLKLDEEKGEIYRE